MGSDAGRGVREGLEVRKLHIVYFLCRNGKTEQPHLIRVHHLNRNGVHLQDVKRWLSELRGREMPESFSWSYKRSYRAGYIWQDLVDGDLITPFSDNEYVLKGSILPPAPDKTVEDLRPFQERNISTDRKQNIVVEEEEEGEEEEETYMPKSNTTHETLQIDDNISPKPPPSGDESPVKPATSSSIFDDNRKNASVFKADRRREGRCSNEAAMKKSGSKGDRRTSKGRSEAGHRRRAANFIKNILRCKMVEAEDSAENASPEQSMSMSQSNLRGSNNNNNNERHCGKLFKPEKLHSHKMSCTALKEKGKRSSFTGGGQTAETTVTAAAASASAAAGIRRPSKVRVTVL